MQSLCEIDGLDLFFVPSGNKLLNENVVTHAPDDVEKDDENREVLNPSVFKREPESRSVFNESFYVAQTSSNPQRSI